MIYQYSNMAPRLQDKVLYLVLFSLYPSLFWELRDKRTLKNYSFETKAFEPCCKVNYRTWLIFNIVLRQCFLQRDAPGKSIFLVSCVLVIIALPCRYLGEQIAETAMLSLAAPMAWCYLLFFCRLVKYGEAIENEGTEREAPGPALGICHVHESYF